ncbi:uncharacterized protein Dwil_GK13677 [Drosophila willistoni]|uniref:Rho-GAP domain-containing protein n=1 Tax=Drosophila willistoni TaxID=7260 RepID=B4NHK3_DROWI|nr:uncharacterized protein Dwil_GK13677 [Drosophila willistoni]
MELKRDAKESLSTLRRPVAVVKKRSGPLEDVLDQLDRSTDAAKPNPAEVTQPILVNRIKTPAPITASIHRRRCSAKDKDKKRERWLLTRKTWRYMTDAGRKLIPDSLQNAGVDSIPIIEAQFQRACASEPRFILWRRKSSFPGAYKSPKRRLKLLSRHTRASGSGVGIGGFGGHPNQLSDQYANADQTIELLQSYLKIRDAFKTTTLLGSKTVRPDQTSSPSAQRPILINSSKSNTGVGSTPAISADSGSTAEAEILSRLKLLSQNSMLGLDVGKISNDILEDKVLLKKIYNSLKKQQLHRMLHSTEPPSSTSSGSSSKYGISRAISLSSLSSLGCYESNTNRNRPTSSKDETKTKTVFNMDKYLRTSQNLKSMESFDLKKRLRKPPETLDIISNKNLGIGLSPPLPIPLSPQSTAPTAQPRTKDKRERSVNTCGTQTSFIQLCELRYLAEQYELMLEHCNSNSASAASEEEPEKQSNAFSSRRKSSIDNEDISQSVSNTIKRYLRMARKKSVHDTDANRFKSINYDRNLRNIKAKGEINPPGMDCGTDKAVQTLDAWPVIALEYIRGNENSKALHNAHIEWQRALDERIRKKLEWERSHKEKENDTTADRKDAFLSNSSSNLNSRSTCTSAPNSPTNYSRAIKTSTASGLLTSSSQFLSNIWHGHGNPNSNTDTSHVQVPNAQNGNVNKSSLNAQHETSNMQKSKSLSNVGQFVTKKIWRSRSKSQNRPNSYQHHEFATTPSQKWSPSENYIWVSEHGDKFQISDTSLEKLSETEAELIKNIAVEKIKELNIGGNIDFDRKSNKRRIISKKKALTTSFFDIGRKDKEEHNSRESLFGTSLESCLSRDNKPRGEGLTRSKHSLLQSVFRGGGNGSASAKLSDNVRSCESLPTKSLEFGCNDDFTNLKKPTSTASMQMSQSQFDMRHSELNYEKTLYGESGRPSSYTSLNVPAFILHCIEYLEEHGLQKVGIFRVSTSKKRVKQLREEFDRSCQMRIPENTCPHDVATLLKEFLRDLPEPLLCNHLYITFLETQRIRNRRLQLEGISHLIKLLPIPHRDTLFVLLRFLANVAAHSDDVQDQEGCIEMTGNKMDSSNLSTVFAPNILRGATPNNAESKEQENMSDAINVIRTMIDHYEEIFKVPSDILDLVYSHMLDTCPEKLYDLITRKTHDTEWELHHVEESVMQCSDQASSSDEIVESPKDPKRYGSTCSSNNIVSENIITNKASSHEETLKKPNSRRQSTPMLLESSNVFTASLQISKPEQSLIATKGRNIQTLTPSEPKLPPSISNIGGATLSAKTAEFERNSISMSNGSPTQTQPVPIRKKPLYKRQQLISSSRRN